MKGRTETVICGGSNLRAPMKLDFISSLRDVSPGEWPEIVISAHRKRNGTLRAFVHAEDAGDIFNCIGIVAAPSERLVAMLRTAAVTARPRAFCRNDATVCRADDPEAWGFIAEFEAVDELPLAVSEAISGHPSAAAAMKPSFWTRRRT